MRFHATRGERRMEITCIGANEVCDSPMITKRLNKKYRLQVSIKESLEKMHLTFHINLLFLGNFYYFYGKKSFFGSIFLLSGKLFRNQKIVAFSLSSEKVLLNNSGEVFYQSGWSDQWIILLLRIRDGICGRISGAPKNFQFFSSRVPFNSTFFIQGPPLHP